MERKAVTKAGRRVLIFLLALHGILLAAALMHQPTSIAAHEYAEACQPALQALAQGGDSGNASNCKIREALNPEDLVDLARLYCSFAQTSRA